MESEELNCKRIVSSMIPAVRIRIAEVLDSRYGYKQKDIAAKLGVVQVAVSKYLNKKYSKAVEREKEELKDRIEKEGLVDAIIKCNDPNEVNYRIERFCERTA